MFLETLRPSVFVSVPAQWANSSQHRPLTNHFTQGDFCCQVCGKCDLPRVFSMMRTGKLECALPSFCARESMRIQSTLFCTHVARHPLSSQQAFPNGCNGLRVKLLVAGQTCVSCPRLRGRDESLFHGRTKVIAQR